jgi:hypothetical protein
LVGGVEVEVEDDVARVVGGLPDVLAGDAGSSATVGEAAEGGQPGLQVGDRVLDVQGRWTGLPPGGAASLLAATGGDPARSRLWRELLTDYQVGDVASLVFRDRYGCWGFLDLWRVGAVAPAFTAAEIGFLTDVAPVVTAALRRAQAATFVATPGERPPGPPNDWRCSAGPAP